MKERLEQGFERKVEGIRNEKVEADNKWAKTEKEASDLTAALKRAEAKLEKFPGLELMGIKELMKLNTHKERASIESRKMKQNGSHASSTLCSVCAGP